MNLPAAGGGLSCQRYVAYEVRSARKLDLFANPVGYRTSLADFVNFFQKSTKSVVLSGSCSETEVSEQRYYITVGLVTMRSNYSIPEPTQADFWYQTPLRMRKTAMPAAASAAFRRFVFPRNPLMNSPSLSLSLSLTIEETCQNIPIFPWAVLWGRDLSTGRRPARAVPLSRKNAGSGTEPFPAEGFFTPRRGG
jgi:hypothetical protein